MLYNVVLVSAIKQHESAISIHISLSLQPPYHSPSNPLGCHRVQSWAPWVIQQLPFSYLFYICNVYVSMLLSQFIPLSSSPVQPLVCCPCLCLYSCSAYRFISTIFLDFKYMHWYMIFVFLFLTDFTLYNRLCVHPPH